MGGFGLSVVRAIARARSQGKQSERSSHDGDGKKTRKSGLKYTKAKRIVIPIFFTGAHTYSSA